MARSALESALSSRSISTFAAATSWTVQHNLGRQPMVRCYSNGVEVQPSTLEVTDTDVTATFGTLAVGGTLILL